MNMNQPSKSCKRPSAMALPQYSTVTPIRPMRRLLMRMVSGMVESTRTARFHHAP